MSAEKSKKVDKLVGCEVRLDPKRAGMLVDPTNDFTFSFFDGGRDRLKITEDTQLGVIKRNIKAGTLRVFKNDWDVTDKHGGLPRLRKDVPIVKNVAKRVDPENKSDKGLMRLLQTHNVDDIRNYVENINDFSTLDRILELEKQGENFCHQPRGVVIDLLSNRIRKVSGISVKKEEEDEDQIVLK